MYPLRFEPYLRTMVWGGEEIAPYKGIRTALHKIGESWEISALEGHETVVSDGPLKGRTLGSLVPEFKGKLVGEHVYSAFGDRFPLLVKFIDPAANLSVQVHPGDEMARRLHGDPYGKTEMWYVVRSGPGAHLLCGLDRSITPEEYDRLVAENRIVEALRDYPVQEGDAFFLPAGRIHALCPGAFVAEIQETSDRTYRIYDYNRPGLDGKPRELHTALAREAIDYQASDDYRIHFDQTPDQENVVVSCPAFTTSVLDLGKPFLKDLSGLDSFLVVMCLDGKGRVDVSIPGEGPVEVHAVSLRRGETVLVPACAKKARFLPEAGLKLLLSYIP